MNFYARRYVSHGLAATPSVAAALLAGLTEEEADRRPDPERFTIREALAHLADWEPIWLERVRRIATEDNPLLVGYDEGAMALERDYAHADIAEQLDRLATGRAALLEYLATLPAEAFARGGVRDEIGEVTLDDMVSLILGHDGYHLGQFVAWRRAG